MRNYVLAKICKKTLKPSYSILNNPNEMLNPEIEWTYDLDSATKMRRETAYLVIKFLENCYHEIRYYHKELERKDVVYLPINFMEERLRLNKESEKKVVL